MPPEPARLIPLSAAVAARRRPPSDRVVYELARLRVAGLREPAATLAHVVRGHS